MLILKVKLLATARRIIRFSTRSPVAAGLFQSLYIKLQRKCIIVKISNEEWWMNNLFRRESLA